MYLNTVIKYTMIMHQKIVLFFVKKYSRVNIIIPPYNKALQYTSMYYIH